MESLKYGQRQFNVFNFLSSLFFLYSFTARGISTCAFYQNLALLPSCFSCPDILLLMGLTPRQMRCQSLSRHGQDVQLRDHCFRALQTFLSCSTSRQRPITWHKLSIQPYLAESKPVGTSRTKSILWEYHHLSGANVNGIKKLDGHSQYLIYL